MNRLLINLRQESSKVLRRMLAPPGLRELPPAYPQDFSAFTKKLWERVQPFTMTTKERVSCLEQAVRHVHAHGIAGEIVECGVAAGGSMMAAALTLLELGDSARRIVLYDTYAGMTEPGGEDVSHLGKTAMPSYRKRLVDGVSTWIAHPLEEVRANLLTTGYPEDRLEFVKGPVEQTLPASEHGPIAILRLDTDWYASTKAELEVLYPRLSPGGILLLDDYNRWMGSRKAVDEYFERKGICMFLARIDDHAVVGTKPRD